MASKHLDSKTAAAREAAQGSKTRDAFPPAFGGKKKKKAVAGGQSGKKLPAFLSKK